MTNITIYCSIYSYIEILLLKKIAIDWTFEKLSGILLLESRFYTVLKIQFGEAP